MEKAALSLDQVYAISSVEHFISILYADPDNKFREIIELIDKYKIAEHEDTMQYIVSLLVSKGYLEYAEEFVGKYNIQITKLDK